MCRDIVAHHAAHETAEFAANELVDLLRVLARYDEMKATIDALNANPAFLRGKSYPWRSAQQ